MSVSVRKFYTRASIRESIMSFAARMKQEPAIVVAPEKIIMPVYDPPSSANKAPAVGPPIKELDGGKENRRRQQRKISHVQILTEKK